MPNTSLTDADIEAIATRVVQLIGTQLTLPAQPPAPPQEKPEPPLKPKLAYSLAELADLLVVSQATIYRLEARGLIKALPYFRTKIYPQKEVERLLAGGNPMEPRKRRS